MRKINKNINIAIIFMLIGVFLCSNLGYAGETSLRVPMKIDQDRINNVSKVLSNQATTEISQSERQKLIEIARRYFETHKESIKEELSKLGIWRWTFLLVGSSALKDEIMMRNYSDMDIALIVEFPKKEVVGIKKALHEALGVLYESKANFVWFPETHSLANEYKQVLGNFFSWKVFKEHHLFINPIGSEHFRKDDALALDEKSRGGYYLYYYWLINSEEELIFSDDSARDYLKNKARYFMDQNGVWGAYLNWLEKFEIKRRTRIEERLRELRNNL